MAEWLGNGLQNHVQRFESASDLNENLKRKFGVFFVSKFKKGLGNGE